MNECIPSLRNKLLITAAGAAAAIVLIVHSQLYVPFGTDFTQDYVAAQALRRGESIYGAWGAEWTAQNLDIPVVPNFHPPTMALLTVPFSFLDHATAHIVWNTISLLSCIGALICICRQFRVSGISTAFLVALLPLWNPMQVGLASSNGSLLMASCLIFGWCALQWKHERTAGALFAVPILMKVFPALILGALIAQRRWRAALSSTLCVVFSAALAVWVIGIDDCILFFSQRGPEDIRLWGPNLLNQSIFSLSATLFLPARDSSPLYSSLIAFRSTLALFYFLIVIPFARVLISDYHAARQSQRPFALAGISMLLLSPLTWCHAITMVTVPLMLLGTELRNASRRQAICFMIALCLLSAPDVQIAELLSQYFGAPLPWIAALVVKLPAFGLCLLYLLALLWEDADAASS